MRCIGVFSDDVAGAHAALMIGTGLAEADHRVGVVTGLPAPARRRFGAGDDAVLAFGQFDEADDGSYAVALEWCRREERDLVASLPLAAITDSRLLSRLDVAITVGRDRASAARALRAARYLPGDPDTHHDPSPWFLPCSDQGVLRTAAGLASLSGPPLPVATRALPTVLPRLDHDTEADLINGSASPRCTQAGIVLAAVALTAIAEPRAARIEAATLTDLMSGQGTGRGDIGDALFALAVAYERREEAQAMERRSPIPASRRPVAAGASLGARERVHRATFGSPTWERVRSAR